jgi:hypothetical protein
MRVVLIVILVLLGLSSGGWMVADGIRRLVIGDYVRIDGQLGPWKYVVAAVGLDPMGPPVAMLFVACGAGRLIATAAIATRSRWGWSAMFWSSVLILWFLPIGTFSALLTVALLLLPASRRTLLSR